MLTGAGISTDSGIPDFRGPNGVWTKNPAAEKTATLQHYLADPDIRRIAWQTRLHSPAWDAQPNAGHRSIVQLQQRGVLDSVITQNVDELHQRAGISAAKVIEVHGTMWWTRCWTCDDRRPMTEALDRVRGGEDDPPCLLCIQAGRIHGPSDGVLKSDTISFGQALVPEVIDAALASAERCDVLVAAGSSLSVFPAANVVPRANAGGAKVVIVNAVPTGMDRYADAVLLGQLSGLLPALLGDER
ncbi:MAG: npdA [Ilumatobacteraceae bacterium]|nr:npdA [Ilumatobacteraceae bacterium]